MKKIFLFLVVLFLPYTVYAGIVVCPDTDNSQVLFFDVSGEPRENCLYFNAESENFTNVKTLLSTVERKYLKINLPTIEEMSQAEKDVIDANELSQADSFLRIGAKAQYDGQTEQGQALRCMAKVILDELNDIRGWTVSFKAEVAAATNLGNLQSRIATLSTLNNRTLSQAKTAIQNCVDNGDVDE